jgi:hypothetical protein
MGPSPRGGAYTYDWIENMLGLDMHSVDRVLEEFQHPEVGDTIGLGPNQMRLERIEPPHVLAWRSADGHWVWAFVLEEQDGTTRLISRNRFRVPTRVARIATLLMEPGSLVMERRMLRGIKERAEGPRQMKRDRDDVVAEGCPRPRRWTVSVHPPRTPLCDQFVPAVRGACRKIFLPQSITTLCRAAL